MMQIMKTMKINIIGVNLFFMSIHTCGGNWKISAST